MTNVREKPISQAVTDAARAAGATAPARSMGHSEAIGGLRGEVLPLLVLHLIASGPSYGNQMIERVAEITEGAIAVNPNSIYPLLRRMERQGLIVGRWEHPDKRTRRFYELTEAGDAEHRRLREELEPALMAMAQTIELIGAELYGQG